jgi:hypothetical protein
MSIENGSPTSFAWLGNDYTQASAALFDYDRGFWYQQKFISTGQGTLFWSSTAGTNVLQLAVDLDNKQLWIALSTISTQPWNGSTTADPATNVGGFDISAIVPGPIYAYGNFLPVAPLTANFGASAYAFTPPSGFGDW